jgi:hypothetical protein
MKTKVISELDRLHGGAYVVNDVRREEVRFANRSLFLTMSGNGSLKAEIIGLIRSAKEVIKVCSFIISDREIYEELKSKAQERNVAIFILTQLDASKLKNTEEMSTYLTEEELTYNSQLTHLTCVKNLYDEGAHVRASESAHAKFIVVDRNRGFIMSANLTTPSLTLNVESGLYINQDATYELDKLFDVIFQKGTLYRHYITASRRKTFVVQAGTTVTPEELPQVSAHGIRFTLDDWSNSLYNEILVVIRNSQEYLYLSTYCIVALDRLPEFLEELRAARSRGVVIKIFCRGMNYRNDHLAGSLQLARMGAVIFGDYYNHSKGIISEKAGLIFTANIDGRHGLKNGFEVGYVLNEEERKEFLEFHDFLFESSIYRYALAPTRKRFFDAYKTYEEQKGLRVPAFPDNITIEVDSDVRIDLDGPHADFLFISKFTSGTCSLSLAGGIYECSYKEGKITLRGRSKTPPPAEKYLLKFKNLTINTKA